ncbi:hypothetical protein KI387_012251, partial [Taxus chinensis]
MDIHVKVSTGQTITLEVKTFETIEQVKEKINNGLGIPIPRECKQQLFYRTVVSPLKDILTVGYYNMKQGSLLHFEVDFPDEDDGQILRIAFYQYRKKPVCTYFVKRNETVESVRNKLLSLVDMTAISGPAGISPLDSFEDKTLTLFDHSIPDGVAMFLKAILAPPKDLVSKDKEEKIVAPAKDKEIREE